MDARELTTKIGENLSVRRAFGAVHEGDGPLVIPVALVAGGAGGAQGPMPTIGHGAPEWPSGAGGSSPTGGDQAGGGIGGWMMPIGAYLAKDDQVRSIPAMNATPITLAGLAAIRVLARLRVRKRRA